MRPARLQVMDFAPQGVEPGRAPDHSVTDPTPPPVTRPDEHLKGPQLRGTDGAACERLGEPGRGLRLRTRLGEHRMSPLRFDDGGIGGGGQGKAPRQRVLHARDRRGHPEQVGVPGLVRFLRAVQDADHD